MADKSNQLLLDGLTRAAADPGGLPLFSGKKNSGLFPNTSAAKQAAQRCVDDGLLRRFETGVHEQNGADCFVLSEKGLAHLLGQSNPKAILEEFVRALDARRQSIGELAATASRWHASFEVFRAGAEKILEQIRSGSANGAIAANDCTASANGSDAWLPALLHFLRDRQNSNALDDCSLPDLFRQARQISPQLSVGHFHDGLRSLHAREQIYLHPWTGPLHELPEPAVALLVGHEVAYYASPRS